jgi:hypothetical protein
MRRQLLLLPLVLALGGCSPNPDPFLALRMTGDRPAIVVADCARDEMFYVSVNETSSASAPPTTVGPGVEWVVGAPPRSGVPAPAEVIPFDVPEGWAGESLRLDHFREGVEYYVSGGPANIGLLTFTLADLRALAPGQVLAPTGYNKKHVVTDDEFQKAARKFCAD